jgi:hypothetical protein
MTMKGCVEGQFKALAVIQNGRLTALETCRPLYS